MSRPELPDSSPLFVKRCQYCFFTPSGLLSLRANSASKQEERGNLSCFIKSSNWYLTNFHFSV